MVLKLERMERARVVCMQADAQKVVDALYDFGWIHVSRSKVGSPGVPFPEFEAVSENLISLRAIEKTLGLQAGVDVARLEPLEKLLAESSKLRAEFAEFEECRQAVAALASRAVQLREKMALAGPLAAAGLRGGVLGATGLVEFRYFELKGGKSEFGKAVAGLPCELLFSGNFVLAGIGRKRAAEFLQRASPFCRELPLPQAEGTFASQVAAWGRELDAVAVETAVLEKRAEALGKSLSGVVPRVRCHLEEHAKKASLPNKFGRTALLEVVEGWVPSRRFSELKSSLSRVVGARVLVEAAAAEGEPPTLLNNPPLIRRFEFMVRFFSLPSSREYDPTLFIAISFPVIFGMILGDIGYGLLAVLLSVLLYRGGKGFVRNLAGMMFISAVMTVVWGVVFGEFFGSEEMLGIKLHPIIERGGEGITLLMAAALVVGVIHLALGLLIGFVTNVVHKHYGHAAAKVCWLLIEAGLLLFGISLFAPFIFGDAMVAAGLIALGVVGLFKLEGLPAVTEVPGLLSNMLSYLRIMALGLSGVILSRVVNTVPVGSSFDSLVAAASSGNVLGAAVGVLPFLAFTAIFVLGHAVALGLGLFESGIQSLRLHYVEFFSKFYHGGGAAFVPLRDKSNGL